MLQWKDKAFLKKPAIILRIFKEKLNIFPCIVKCYLEPAVRNSKILLPNRGVSRGL